MIPENLRPIDWKSYQYDYLWWAKRVRRQWRITGEEQEKLKTFYHTCYELEVKEDI